VAVEGTLLPGRGAVVDGLAGLRSLEAAYCAVGRFERAALRRKGRARGDLIRLLAACSEVSAVRIAELVGVDASTVRHAGRRKLPWMQRVLRVVDDPRFDHLEQLDRVIAWYRPWSRREDVD